jgi:transposase
MSNYVGIDVSSKNLDIHIHGLQKPYFKIENSKEALIQFIKEQKLNPKNFVIGVESTGRCHLIAQEFFVKQGFEFRVINPILTNQKIQTSIRKKKTDASDAKIITQLLIQGEGAIIKKEDLKKTKRTILRSRKTVVDHRSAIKRLITDLKKEPIDIQINETIESLEKVVTSMDECVEELEAKTLNKEQETNTEKLIKTIPGFATTLAAVVSSEVGDFSKFPNATKFKAYVGIDPKVTQSGGMLKTGRITKRGNTHLRHAFYIAAQVARIHDPNLKKFFDKKRSEGKHFKVAVCAVARKLCEVVFAVVKQGSSYDVDYAK